MRPASPRYPVDRYLVESSKKFEFVNILDDDIWHSEPALRPEDEIILRKLHEMLQSTADDLKALSGELSKFHKPGIQVKTPPMPLDEEFNEKVHIEEVVNAKFHGHKIVEKPPPPMITPPKVMEPSPIPTAVKPPPKLTNQQQKAIVNKCVQVNAAPLKNTFKSRNLGITRTKCVEINCNSEESTKSEVCSNFSKPAVSYNEYTFKYEPPKSIVDKCKKLQKQDMPSINIRNELKEQKVLQLDIYPQANDKIDSATNKPNVAVIAIEHDTALKKNLPTDPQKSSQIKDPSYVIRQPIRKVSKMSVYDSSASTNISSDTQQKNRTTQHIRSVTRKSPKTSARSDVKNYSASKKDISKRSKLHLDEWRRKLNVVYGPSTSKQCKTSSTSGTAKKVTSEKSKIKQTSSSEKRKQNLNNAEYIPYNQLTLGGVRVSDIEKEISNIPNKSNIPLSPILDKILSSRENTIREINSYHKHKNKDSPRILTTSDENLLEEVLNIEINVSETISKNEKNLNKMPKGDNATSESDKNDTYDDDFEDEKSDSTQEGKNRLSHKQTGNNSSKSDHEAKNTDSSSNNSNQPNANQTKNPNKTYSIPNLSLKSSVDIFEFIHAIDTQDTATQSNTAYKISLKETQTSPRNDKPKSLQPIRNDLWSSVEPKEETFDPKGEIEKLFKVEKDLIRKIIIEEYGDLIESNICKPSTSKEVKTEGRDKNIYSYQKNTQTSPAHVKSIMTSPTRTKTRTTSPFLSVAIDHQTSPMVIVTNERAINVSVEDEEDGISINLSSPKFSLRLPQSSREVLSNLENNSLSPDNSDKEKKQTKRTNKTSNSDKRLVKSQNTISKVHQGTNTCNTKNRNSTSSSSADVEKSSSELSSLGEVKLKLKRKNKNHRVPTLSESSSTSSSSQISSCVGIIPLRSEGEISQEQNNSRKLKSEGELSLGPFL